MNRPYVFHEFSNVIINARSVNEARTILILSHISYISKYIEKTAEYTWLFRLMQEYYCIDDDNLFYNLKCFNMAGCFTNWQKFIDTIYGYVTVDSLYNSSFTFASSNPYCQDLKKLALMGKQEFRKKLNFNKTSFLTVFMRNPKSLIKYFNLVEWPHLFNHNITMFTSYSINRILKKIKNMRYWHIYRMLNIFNKT